MTHRWKYGIEFTRQGNGDVMMQVGEHGGHYVFTAAEWISVVTAMAAEADTATTHQAVKRLHANG